MDMHLDVLTHQTLEYNMMKEEKIEVNEINKYKDIFYKNSIRPEKIQFFQKGQNRNFDKNLKFIF